MPRALSRNEVLLQRMLSRGNWFKSSYGTPGQVLRSVGITPDPQSSINWNSHLRDLIATQEAQDREDYFPVDLRVLKWQKEQEAKSKIQHYKAQTELEELRNRVMSQQQQAARTGTDLSETNKPSLLERVFDVISRPNYAVANAFHAQNEAQRTEGFSLRNIDDMARAAREGWTGREKTTFRDVLDQPENEGLNLSSRGKAILGFGLDVALDPTTYAGTGLVKKAGKEAIEQAGRKAVLDAYKPGSSVYRTGRNAVAKATAANKGRILPRSTQQKIFNDAVGPMLQSTRKAAEETAAELGKGRIALQVLGKEVLTGSGKPRLISEAAYKELSRLGKLWTDTTVGGALNKAFRTRAVLPGKLHRYQRMFAGRGVSDLQASMKTWRTVTKDLTKADSDSISRAIQDGVDLSGVTGAKGADLGQIQQDAQGMLRQMWLMETAMGYRRAKDYLPNYIPHFAKKGTVESQRAWHNAITKTFDEGLEAGHKPVTDIRDLIARRAARYHQRKVQFDLIRQLEGEFGIKAARKNSAKTAPRWSELEKAGFSKISHPTARTGYAFPPVIVDFVDEMQKLAGDPEYAADLLRIADQSLNAWKSAVTVVNPGFHVRNTIGDIFLNWMADVRNPNSYRQAASVMAKGRLGKTVRIAKGLDVPVEDLEYLYHKAGLNVGFFRTELGDTGVPLVKQIRAASEHREQWARMTHFVDKLKKRVGTSKKKITSANFRIAVDEIAQEIGDDVRKFNIDYGDLTPFERKFAKRVIPFYTWMRKSTPLLLESLFLQPGKFAKLPKGQRALEQLLGSDEVDQNVEDAIPKWITDYSALRIAGGDEPGYVGAGSVLPIQVLGEFTNPRDIFKYLGGMTHPLIQTVFEQATGKEIFSGFDIGEESQAQYLSGKTPLTRLAAKAKSGDLKQRDIVNMLLGVGYQNVDEGRQRGELIRQEQSNRSILSRKKKELEEMLK